MFIWIFYPSKVMAEIRVTCSKEFKEEIEKFRIEKKIVSDAAFARTAMRIILDNPDLLLGVYIPVKTTITENKELRILREEITQIKLNLEKLFQLKNKGIKTVNPDDYL